MRIRIAVLAIIAAITALFGIGMCHAQASRFAGNVYTINSSAPQPGALYPVLANTNATVQICAYSPSQTCPSLATTYTNAAQSSSCPTTAQLTPSNSGACTAQVDAQGNFGAWLVAGNYQYMVTTSYGTFGPYDFSVGGGGSSGGGVTSLNTLAGALSIICGNGLSCVTGGSTITISTATAFAINSFTGCNGSLELGATVSNPTCNATYTTTPSSAVITNTDGVDSPLTLTTPFTSGTISGSFVHTSTHTTTITLTTVPTGTATQTYTWNPRIFGGVGAPGATSTVTATGTSALLSTSDVIPSAGLGAETTGQIIGSYSPTGQCIYLLLTGGSHTFTDNVTGFPMAFNAPMTVSFVNVNGVTVSMYLYQSTNLLTGNFSPKVAS